MSLRRGGAAINGIPFMMNKYQNITVNYHGRNSEQVR